MAVIIPTSGETLPSQAGAEQGRSLNHRGGIPPVDRQNKCDFFLSSGIAPHVLGTDKAQYVNFPEFSNAILLQV